MKKILTVLALMGGLLLAGTGTANAEIISETQATATQAEATVLSEAAALRASSWGIVAASLNTAGGLCPPNVYCSTSWS